MKLDSPLVAVAFPFLPLDILLVVLTSSRQIAASWPVFGSHDHHLGCTSISIGSANVIGQKTEQPTDILPQIGIAWL